jgi:transcriptional regulator with XRE-family HTH domain
MVGRMMEEKKACNQSRKNLGRILKQKRQSVNLTLHKVSEGSGVSTSHLGRIEKGERFPSADILQRIAKPLGFSESEIFSLAGYLSSTGEGTESPSIPAEKTQIDPYVAKVLAEEPVEVQRAVVGILTMLKSLAGNLNQ